MRVDAASERGGDSGNVGPGQARPLAGELSSIGCDYDRESRRGDRCARKCNANKPPRAPTAPVALPHAFVPGRFRAFPAQQPICASRDRRATRSAPGRSADTAAWRHERASRRTFSRPRSGRAREARQACQCALASPSASPEPASAFHGGCCTNPRRARWIASKGGLRKSPSHPSRADRPSRGHRAWLLWRALPRARRGSSETALCNSLHGGCCTNRGLSAPALTIRGMAQNFIECDREQEFLLPPSLREWLPEGHFAWFVIDAVAQLDLSAFYAAYRADGHGRAAHDPAMMVALLLYAYAIGGALVAAHRAALRGGCRDARDLRQPGARSLHDRAFSPAPRGGAGRPVR
jgi:hypothetical protein